MTPLFGLQQASGVLTVAPPLQVLIEAGAELDAPDLQGNTPIHYASSWGHIVVRL